MPKNDITYNFGEQYLLINLGNRIDIRIKILFFAEFLFTAGLATIFLLQSLPFAASITHIITGIASTIIYFLASYRFLSRLFFNEKLVVDQNALTIIQRTPFYQKSAKYAWRNMGPIHYIGKMIKTDHPLKGGCYDYFGFETQEHLIQSLHHKGNVYFSYPGENIHFARGVYSWDAEKLIYMIKLFVGSTVQLGPEWAQMLQEQEYDTN